MSSVFSTALTERALILILSKADDLKVQILVLQLPTGEWEKLLEQNSWWRRAQHQGLHWKLPEAEWEGKKERNKYPWGRQKTLLVSQDNCRHYHSPHSKPQHRCRHCTCILSTHNSPYNCLRWVLVQSSFYRWGSWGKKWSDFPKPPSES